MIRTLAAKVIDGFHSQGWRPLGHGGTWTGAMRPLEQYIQRKVERAVKAEREACARVCEEKQEYSMPIPCPDGISGCLVAHYVPARREKTGGECAAAIRARGNK